MTITDKLSTFYAKCQDIGYTPNSVGVSDEEYDALIKALKDMTEFVGLSWTASVQTLSYKGIELKKYGKKHRDSKIVEREEARALELSEEVVSEL